MIRIVGRQIRRVQQLWETGWERGNCGYLFFVTISMLI